MSKFERQRTLQGILAEQRGYLNTHPTDTINVKLQELKVSNEPKKPSNRPKINYNEKCEKGKAKLYE